MMQVIVDILDQYFIASAIIVDPLQKAAKPSGRRGLPSSEMRCFVGSSEMLVNLHQASHRLTRHNTNLHSHCPERLECYILGPKSDLPPKTSIFYLSTSSSSSSSSSTGVEVSIIFNHYHDLAVRELGNSLARSGLIRPGVYSKVFSGSLNHVACNFFNSVNLFIRILSMC
jgi:hypothetical protein